MPSPDTLLTVRRSILPLEHTALRQNISPIDLEFGDASIRWLHLGKTGVNLLKRQDYLGAAEKASGKLAATGTQQIADNLSRELAATTPSVTGRLSVGIIDVAYFGVGQYLNLGYLAEDETLNNERRQLTAWLNEQNGVSSNWGEFTPHIPLAVIQACNATDEILDAFWDIAPDSITLLPLTTEVK